MRSVLQFVRVFGGYGAHDVIAGLCSSKNLRAHSRRVRAFETVGRRETYAVLQQVLIQGRSHARKVFERCLLHLECMRCEVCQVPLSTRALPHLPRASRKPVAALARRSHHVPPVPPVRKHHVNPHATALYLRRSQRCYKMARAGALVRV